MSDQDSLSKRSLVRSDSGQLFASSGLITSIFFLASSSLFLQFSAMASPSSYMPIVFSRPVSGFSIFRVISSSREISSSIGSFPVWVVAMMFQYLDVVYQNRERERLFKRQVCE